MKLQTTLIVAAAMAIVVLSPARGDSIGSGTERSASKEITLTDAVRRLDAANPSLEAAEWRTRAAERSVWEARSGLLPSLSLRGEYTRYEEANLVTPMHEAPSPMSESPLEFEEEIYTGVARLTVPLVNLPAIGRIGASKGAASARSAERDRLEQRLTAAVVEVFVQARQIDDSLSLIDAYIAALERRREEIGDLRSEGRVPPAQVAELEARLDARHADRLELEGRRYEVSLRLGELLGYDEAVDPASTEFNAPEFEPAPAPTGPALEHAEAQLEAAKAQRRAAGLSFAPRVDGFYTDTARSGPDRDFTSEWQAGLSVTIPFLTGGERATRFAAAAAELSAARSAREAARIGQERELSAAERSYDIAGERRRLTARAANNQETSVDSTRDRYDEGRTSLSDLLQAEADLLELRISERRLLYEQVLAFVAYHRAAGELSIDLVESLTEE